jgi:hypothetical protein
MSSPISPEAVSSSSDRTTDGHFAKGEMQGPRRWRKRPDSDWRATARLRHAAVVVVRFVMECGEDRRFGVLFWVFGRSPGGRGSPAVPKEKPKRETQSGDPRRTP